MRKIFLLSLFIILNQCYLYSQKTTKQIENEKWLKNYSKSEGFWKTSNIKGLLEEKLDESKASKSETQKWIVDKLSSYIVKNYETKGRFKYNNPIDESPMYEYESYSMLSKQIYFEQNYLILHFSYKVTSNDWTSPKYKEWSDSIYIPDLENITYSYTSELNFWFFDNSIQKNLGRIYTLRFDFDRESAIGFRMKKAFVHLCSFYWKTVKNETF